MTETHNMAFGADFETDTGSSGFIGINCHRPLNRRSSSKYRYTDRRKYKIMELSKRERQLFDLRKYSLDDKTIDNYLLDNSNLPGKRGNIELGFSFADYIEENYINDKSKFFKYCL